MNKIAVMMIVLAQFAAVDAFANPRKFRLAQSPTATFNSCMIACDTQAGLCQNNCTIAAAASSAVTTTPPGGNAQCMLSCNQTQLVCKQSCGRFPN